MFYTIQLQVKISMKLSKIIALMRGYKQQCGKKGSPPPLPVSRCHTLVAQEAGSNASTLSTQVLWKVSLKYVPFTVNTNKTQKLTFWNNPRWMNTEHELHLSQPMDLSNTVASARTLPHHYTCSNSSHRLSGSSSYRSTSKGHITLQLHHGHLFP